MIVFRLYVVATIVGDHVDESDTIRETAGTTLVAAGGRSLEPLHSRSTTTSYSWSWYIAASSTAAAAAGPVE